MCDETVQDLSNKEIKSILKKASRNGEVSSSMVEMTMRRRMLIMMAVT